MPFNELHRRDSWPPTQIRLQDEDHLDDDIDDDPFAYFLTSAADIDLEDIDSEFDEDLSAGIESAAPKPVVREISPSSLQRKKLEEDEEDDEEDYIRDISDNLGLPVSLLDFSSAHNKKRPLRRSRPSIENPSREEYVRAPASPSLRGRTVRLTPPAMGRGRARNRTRSLSAQRPHVWREPSPDVWSIPEESEGSGSDKDRNADVPELFLNGDKLEIEGEAKDGFVTKLKKKVRWAALPSRY